MKNKRGFEWELSKIIVAVLILTILIIAISVLLSGKGGQILDAIKNMLRMGRA